jgi:alpha-beta hydrolase superfamily lysophospholipase
MSTVGPLHAEITRPESEKFTAPLVLLHGLWERPPAWRRFAGYLAHRGWHCIALERRPDASDIAAHLADLRAAIAALDAPPVLLGHDFGGLLALHCAEIARAAAAVAPLVGPPLVASLPALEHAGSWLARRRGAPLHAPRGRWSNAYPIRDIAEDAGLLKQILAGALPPLAAPGETPRAVFGTEADEIVEPSALRAFANAAGAEVHMLDRGGHAILDTPGWERVVAAVHRWIIQELGVDLLALYDESMQTE